MPQTKKTVATKQNGPVKKFRARGVNASVFENEAEGGAKFYKVSLQRVYREGEEFKTTNSLGRDDIPVARHLLQKAWDFILEAEANRSREDVDE